jgi:hypothetical protein
VILPSKTVADIMNFVEVGIAYVEAVVTRIVTWDISLTSCYTSDIVLDVFFNHTLHLN